MGVDTKGTITRAVTKEEILTTIINHIDDKAVIDIISKDSSCMWVTLTWKGEVRNLFVYFDKEDTGLSLGYNKVAIEIITEILKHFGGLLLTDDCSGVEEIFIPKKYNVTQDYIRKVEQLTKLQSLLGVDYKIALKIISNKQALKLLLD